MGSPMARRSPGSTSVCWESMIFRKKSYGIWLFFGRLCSRRVRRRFTNQSISCRKGLLDYNAVAANGEERLTCLSGPRGLARRRRRESDRS
jgi:hypothetical protein